MTDRAQALRSMPWAASLPRGVIDWLASSVEEVTFDRGDILITQGATDRDCYLVVSGDVEVVIDGQVVGTSGPGEPEGEMALLYRQPRRATVTALEQVLALKLSAEDFDDWAKTEPDSAQAFADALIAHLTKRFGWQLQPWTPS